MKLQVLKCAVALTAAWQAATCSGHGTPIVVHVANGQLQVSNGVADATGYADWVYADPDPESWLVPGPNAIQLSTLPGFDVNDMQSGDALSVEILSRPDFSRPGRPQRWLWHWNQAADEVTLATEDQTLELVSVRGFLPSISLLREVAPAAATLKVADVLETDLGEHRHTVLYKLDDAPAAAVGVFGFFGRLKSPGYQPSEPFLVALNNGLEDALAYQEGALAINAAAGLAGDFDVDGDVDGTDFLAWEKMLGVSGSAGTYPAADGALDGAVNAADLAIWREEFGRLVLYPPPEIAAVGVPEPGALVLLTGTLIAVGIPVRGQRPNRIPLAPNAGLP